MQTLQERFEKINGTMTYPGFYKDMVARLRYDSRFVEVGSYEGKSLFYFIMEALKAKKYFNITAIDDFSGVGLPIDVGLRERFFYNMSVFDGFFSLIEGSSWESANRFEDESLDLVFIDASHDYKSVRKDIDAWLPKVKKGGILSGHDYNSLTPDVIRAVEETFPDGINPYYLPISCWFIEL